MKKIKVALGLSGGVDSAVSAYLLKSYGYDVHCVYLNCYDGDTPGCRGDNDRKDALAVALHLGLPFQVLDFRKQYKSAVIDYFKKEYLAGRTPNPDVVCNRDIKFGLFMDWAVKEGFDYMATGHYADGPDFSEGKIAGTPAPRKLDTSEREAGSLRLKREFYWGATPLLHIPTDLHKDQTYFLWAVPAEKFKRVLFPLWNLLKTEVREIALKIGLPVAKKKDSTGICFVGEVRVEDFLKRLGVKEKEGEVVIRKTRNSKLETRNNAQNSNVQNIKQKNVLNLGNSDLEFVSNFDIRDSNLIDNYAVIGRHKGVWFYTIGQRHGFSVDRWPPKNNTEYRMMNTELEKRQTQHSEFPARSGYAAGVAGGSIQNSVFLDRPPLYVIDKDIKKNRLIVGFGAETYRDQFVVSDTNWLIPNTEYRILNKKQKKSSSDHSEFSIQNSKFKNCFVRIRHGGELMPCQLLSVSSRKLEVALATPARGIAAGQSAVFYSKDGTVVGGGIIQ